MPDYLIPLNILIADDHQIMVDGLSQILKDEKMIGGIYTANDGKKAYAIAIEQPVDCVIMDINMPGLNGIESTKLIKQHKPTIKILMISMLCDAAIVSRAMKAGADAFIIKNTGKTELLKAIKKVMKDEKYISEELSYDLFRRSIKNDTGTQLTPREKEIIRYIAEGLTNQEIAAHLCISHRTVDTHRKNILNKLELKNTASLIKYAAENYLL